MCQILNALLYQIYTLHDKRAKPSLSSDYNLLFKNKIGERSLDIHRERMRVLRTLSITPLIRELTGTLFLKNLSTKTNGLMTALILQLVQEAPVTPADLALPAETGLRRTAEMILSKGLWNTPLEQFAAALNMTPVTFSRHFQTDTGMTFRDWRHRARLTLSMELLAQGLTVKQTALRLGFSDPCVFTAAFRRLFGATPTALMRNHTKPAAT